MTPDEDQPSASWDGSIGPWAWGPIGGGLLVGVIALAVMLLLGVNGGSVTNVTQQCIGGTPGCDLRPLTHEHLDFAVFIRGKQFNFDSDQFVSRENSEKGANVHIHDPRHTVVHLHRQGVTWDEFFRAVGSDFTDATLGAKKGQACLRLTSGGEKYCESATETFKFFVNGVQIDGLAGHELHDLDRVLISFGSESVADVTRDQLAKVTDQACIPGELCADRAPKAGEAPEPCSKSGGICH